MQPAPKLGTTTLGRIAQRATWEDLEEITDHFFDKMALLCPSGQIDSCAGTTTDGHPIAVDRHHLTFEFATFIGERLKADNPEWLQRLRE